MFNNESLNKIIQQAAEFKAESETFGKRTQYLVMNTILVQELYKELTNTENDEQLLSPVKQPYSTLLGINILTHDNQDRNYCVPFENHESAKAYLDLLDTVQEQFTRMELKRDLREMSYSMGYTFPPIQTGTNLSKIIIDLSDSFCTATPVYDKFHWDYYERIGDMIVSTDSGEKIPFRSLSTEDQQYWNERGLKKLNKNDIRTSLTLNTKGSKKFRGL